MILRERGPLENHSTAWGRADLKCLVSSPLLSRRKLGHARWHVQRCCDNSVDRQSVLTVESRLADGGDEKNPCTSRQSGNRRHKMSWQGSWDSPVL